MMMKEKKRVPMLRFEGFEGEYKRRLFDDVFIFSTGKNIKQKEAAPEFETPCIRYGELYYMYGEVIYEIINKTNLDKSELHFSEGNEILLPSAGEDPLDIGLASALNFKDIAIGRTINILRPKEENVYSQNYVSYYINEKLKKKIATLAKGVSISNVYNSDLRGLKINLPTIDEQQKIALFLTSIDTRIQQLEKKKTLLEQYKKGVMQRIFKQEVRFKDDDGEEFSEWEEKRLGDMLDYEQPTKFIVKSTEYDDSFTTPVLTAGKTFILGYTDETNNIYTDFPVIIFDDFTMATQFVDFPFKVKSSAMKILKPSNSNFNIKFLFEAIQMIRYPKGDEHKRFWISEYSKIKIGVPSIEEQTKIAHFLTSLDKKIAVMEQQIVGMKEWKKGVLQRMFV